MHRSPRLASVLAALALFAAVAAPAAVSSPAAAAGECGAYRSETVPPPTIRVYRTATGAVDTVDFRTYVKNVLSREWISSWTTESLRSGALAVKNYAWYQVVHWRGYVNASGQCFDVFDSTRDQHYDPSRPTYASMAAAVDATWSTLAHRNGRIFATYYNAGQAFEACGARANGWQMFQWGTQACGLDGKSAAQIMAIYYPGVVVSAAPTPASPTPTPTAAPTPTPTPSPAPTPAPSAAPGSKPPASTPTPAPTPPPAATPSPAPTPPPQQPGGGQVGLSAPPPPPPPDPDPIVVAAPAQAAEISEAPRVTPAASTPDAVLRLLVLEAPAADERAARRLVLAARPQFTVGWMSARGLFGRFFTAWSDRWLSGFARAEQPGDGQLGGGHVLDRQPDRLEDRDRVGRTAVDPAAIDGSYFHEVGFRH